MSSYTRPRIVLAGVSSGVGKTTVVTGLSSLLHAQGLSVQPFKVGPDYIDPGFHAKAAGRESYNLDTWLAPEDRLASTFAKLSEGADISLIEGVMGLYDGGGKGISSTAQIAKLLHAPVVLIINCQSVGASAAAIAMGYRDYDPEVSFAGVILNKLGSDKHEAMIREAMADAGIPVFGALHRDADLKTPERHLGLTPVTEVETSGLIRHMQEDAGRWIDAEALIRTARQAPAIECAAEPRHEGGDVVCIGIARDEAFTFYYPASLAALEARGAELVPFSPMRDAQIPDVDGLIFGGGFPEMFLQELAGNESMKKSITVAAKAGMPVYAECGGLMYLCRDIIDFEGRCSTMTGLVPAVCRMQKKLQRVGYVTASAQRPSILAEPGDTIRGHEFHFSTMEPLTGDFPWAYEMKGIRQAEPHKEGYACGNVLASYLHMNFDGSPRAADALIRNCREWRNRNEE